jgi:hypothetical protein
VIGTYILIAILNIMLYHDATIELNYDTLMLDAPTLTIPAPISAPTTQWVPEIGIPNSEDTIINKKALNYISGYKDKGEYRV